MAIGRSGTVTTAGFPDPGLQGFAPKVLAHGQHAGRRPQIAQIVADFLSA